MNMYNLLFGRNPQSELLLAVIGLKENDVERLRDVSASEDGKQIYVYTRTGGGNREDFPNTEMRSLPCWLDSVDDDYDSTYCTDTFNVPEGFAQDVVNLKDILQYGIRPEFGQHLRKTAERTPTPSDIEANLYRNEEEKLKKTRHVMANGHTFVPYNDGAMQTALEIAEKNNGKLRSCLGIMPLVITVKQNHRPFKGETHSDYIERVEISYEWVIDAEYWSHCQEKFTDKFPLSMAVIAEKVNDYQTRKKS